MIREGECIGCGGCCRKMRITGILSHVIGQHGSMDEARAYYSFRKIAITQVDPSTDTLCFELDIPCDKLTPGNHCLLHGQPELKPVICHRYPMAPDDIEGCGFNWR
ncbi:MAG: hypothetical protein HZB29_05160 [Nitrospinae bacterium]|nr:hypothetical protein [Nitrospinota bacterium]